MDLATESLEAHENGASEVQSEGGGHIFAQQNHTLLIETAPAKPNSKNRLSTCENMRREIHVFFLFDEYFAEAFTQFVAVLF